MGAFNQSSEALFPGAGALGYVVSLAPRCLSGLSVLPATLPALFSATLSLALSVYLCTNVGQQGLLVVRPHAPFVPHSASLGPSTATRVLSAPAACLHPSYRSG